MRAATEIVFGLAGRRSSGTVHTVGALAYGLMFGSVPGVARRAARRRIAADVVHRAVHNDASSARTHRRGAVRNDASSAHTHRRAFHNDASSVHAYRRAVHNAASRGYDRGEVVRRRKEALGLSSDSLVLAPPVPTNVYLRRRYSGDSQPRKPAVQAMGPYGILRLTDSDFFGPVRDAYYGVPSTGSLRELALHFASDYAGKSLFVPEWHFIKQEGDEERLRYLRSYLVDLQDEMKALTVGKASDAEIKKLQGTINAVKTEMEELSQRNVSALDVVEEMDRVKLEDGSNTYSYMRRPLQPGQKRSDTTELTEDEKRGLRGVMFCGFDSGQTVQAVSGIAKIPEVLFGVDTATLHDKILGGAFAVRRYYGRPLWVNCDSAKFRLATETERKKTVKHDRASICSYISFDTAAAAKDLYDCFTEADGSLMLEPDKAEPFFISGYSVGTLNGVQFMLAARFMMIRYLALKAAKQGYITSADCMQIMNQLFADDLKTLCDEGIITRREYSIRLRNLDFNSMGALEEKIASVTVTDNEKAFFEKFYADLDGDLAPAFKVSKLKYHMHDTAVRVLGNRFRRVNMGMWEHREALDLSGQCFSVASESGNGKLVEYAIPSVSVVHAGDAGTRNQWRENIIFSLPNYWERLNTHGVVYTVYKNHVTVHLHPRYFPTRWGDKNEKLTVFGHTGAAYAKYLREGVDWDEYKKQHDDGKLTETELKANFDTMNANIKRAYDFITNFYKSRSREVLLEDIENIREMSNTIDLAVLYAQIDNARAKQDGSSVQQDNGESGIEDIDIPTKKEVQYTRIGHFAERARTEAPLYIARLEQQKQQNTGQAAASGFAR